MSVEVCECECGGVLVWRSVSVKECISCQYYRCEKRYMHTSKLCRVFKSNGLLKTRTQTLALSTCT